MKSLLKKIKEKWNNYRKIKNTFNPFANNLKNNNSIINILDRLINTTPEEEKEIAERVLRMINHSYKPYEETKINDYEFKYTHIIQKDDFYFMVNEIKMTNEEYENYLSKKSLNHHLNKNLKNKIKEKTVKI